MEDCCRLKLVCTAKRKSHSYMKHLWLILFTSFSLAWAQDLTLKKNSKTATITHNQPIEIISKDNDVFKGRFLRIEKNIIIVEGSYNGNFFTIPFNQVKEIKLPTSRLYSAFKGCMRGGLILGGTASGISALILLSEEPSLDAAILIAGLAFAAPIGAALNAIRYYIKFEEASFKIDQDNWKIVAD